MLTASSRKVLLFLPPYSGKLLGPPLGLLSLAGSLRAAGYIPEIIDGALDRDYLHTIATQAKDCACLGVSLLTGPMIRDAIHASKLFRSIRPDAPIIFGGWHPSLLTGETLREDFVDVVVRHQGEMTMIEILGRMEAGKPLDLVQGCWFKQDGQIRMNPDRPAIPLSDLPLPAYDLVDFDAEYDLRFALQGERKEGEADMVFYNRRFNAHDVDRVVAEMTGLVKRYGLNEIALVDSNFLVDVHRAVAIADGIVNSGTKFDWTFQASTDLLCRMTDDQVEVLAASGVSHIGFGTESASPEVLARMNKRHQHVEDISLNLIFAYPGEEESHRRETLRTMGKIAASYDNVTFSPNLFTPYPGILIWPELRARGLREPASLEEWADVDLGADHLPWLRGRPFAELQRGISYFLLANQLTKARRHAQSGVFRFLLAVLRRPLNWRLQNYFFVMPWELWLTMAQKWLTVRRSLLTGQPLSHELSRSV